MPRAAWQRPMRAAQRKTTKQLGARVPVRRPSGGVAQGDARQDAERGTKGQGRPFVTAPGAAPEGGKSGGAAARPGCRGALLFGYFLLGTQEKVTRRKGERGGLDVRSSFESKLGEYCPGCSSLAHKAVGVLSRYPPLHSVFTNYRNMQPITIAAVQHLKNCPVWKSHRDCHELGARTFS